MLTPLALHRCSFALLGRSLRMLALLLARHRGTKLDAGAVRLPWVDTAATLFLVRTLRSMPTLAALVLLVQWPRPVGMLHPDIPDGRQRLRARTPEPAAHRVVNVESRRTDDPASSVDRRYSPDRYYSCTSTAVHIEFSRTRYSTTVFIESITDQGCVLSCLPGV